MSTPRPLSLIAALVLAGGIQLIAAEQVELHLKSGQVVKGEVVSEDEAQFVVKTVYVGKTGTMTANITYKRPDIDEVVRRGDPEEEYAKRSAEAKSATDHAGLAAWCRDQAMAERAVAQAQQAVALDPDQETAAKVLTDLGWVKVDGKWLKESEWLASQGKVRVQGKIMTVAEADAFKAEQKQQHAQQEAQRTVDEKTAHLATIDRQLADLQKRPEQIDAELAKDNADLATTQSAAQRAASARSAMEAAQLALSQAQAMAQLSNTATAATSNLAALSQASENAQHAYNTAKREAQDAGQDSARLKAKIAALTEEKRGCDKKREDLNAKRATAVKDVDAAKTALAEIAKKAPAPAPAVSTATPPVPAAKP